MAQFLVGFVVGVAVVVFALIVIGPSRLVRRETGMDKEIATRILLGLDPEPEAAPVLGTSKPRDYASSEIQELRDLSKSPKKRRRR